MTTVSATPPDVVNAILGVDDSSAIAVLRSQKPSIVSETQHYYESIFQPTPTSEAALPLATRLIVAVRVSSHTGSLDVVNWYEKLAGVSGIDQATIDRSKHVSEPWNGHSPLDAAIRHADLLTTRPVDAGQSHLQSLAAAGYTPAGIVALSQTIAFVTYQVRIIAGLKAIGNLG